MRKNLGARYIFDTIPLSKIIFERFKICGVEFDGLINIRGGEATGNYKLVTLQQALSERAFILVPWIYYDDDTFDFLHDAGYRYGRDYLIYTPDI